MKTHLILDTVLGAIRSVYPEQCAALGNGVVRFIVERLVVDRDETGASVDLVGEYLPPLPIAAVGSLVEGATFALACVHADAHAQEPIRSADDVEDTLGLLRSRGMRIPAEGAELVREVRSRLAPTTRRKVDEYVQHALALVSEGGARGLESTGVRGAPLLIPLLLRVSDPSWAPTRSDECIVSARMGDVIACACSERGLKSLAVDPDVLEVEASRPSGTRDCEASVPFIRADLVHGCPAAGESGLWPSGGERGESALIAILDSGIDLLHQAFLGEDGVSRVVAIWDQTDTTARSNLAPRVGGQRLYGRLHDAADIERYIRAGEVPSSLGRDTHGGHGTHVASIAAGRRVGAFAGGVAPASRILVVKTKIDVDDFEPESIGYSKSHVDALAFAREFAKSANLPLVVNVSQGMNAGAHDGTSLLERAFDSFSGGGRAPGLVIVKSAGNERARNGHAQLRLGQDAEDILRWTSEHDRRSDVIELWFNSRDEYSFSITEPTGQETPVVSARSPELKGHAFRSGDVVDVSYARYHHDSGDSRLLVAVRGGPHESVSPGVWTLKIVAHRVVSGGLIHAWIERTAAKSSDFVDHASERYTLSVPGTADTVIAVAAVESRRPFRTAEFSSYGPTRREGFKPEIAAPGVRVSAARSGTTDEVRTMCGTSMAAPHVAGAVALALSCRAKQRASGSRQPQLNALQVRAMLTTTSQGSEAPWAEGIGFGVVDVDRFLGSVRDVASVQPDIAAAGRRATHLMPTS